MEIGNILNKLQKVKVLADKSYMASCPSHPDKIPSLHISQKGDNILIKCQAGCKTEDIVKELGLEMADLFTDKKESKPDKIVAEYDYKDRDSNLLFQVVRYEPKSFRQRHKNGQGEWVWDMKDVHRVLYHLPELTTVTNETVYLVEGEKDADNLWMWGQVATTSPGGANSWKDEYAEYLIGKNVCLIPDQDSAGLAYARQVANSLMGKANLKVILLPDKDISDWLDKGNDIETLPSLEQDIEVLFASDKPQYRWIQDSIEWDKKANGLVLTFKAEQIAKERTGIHARITISARHEILSWSYLNIERHEDRVRLANVAHTTLKADDYSKDDMRHDLDSFCAGLWDFHLSQYIPEDMIGEETVEPLSFLLKPYILEFGGTILFAPPGRGKSYTALTWAVSIDSGSNKFWEVKQGKVLFINLERASKSLRRRLSMVNKVLGLPATRPLMTLNARGKSLFDVLPACMKAIKKHDIKMIVLDSISRAGLGDLTEGLSGNRIIDSLSSMCPTWLALGHTSRASDAHIYGTIFQDAGADIVIQLSSQVRDDGTLGIGYQITKQNDIGYHGQKVYALEFDDNGLTDFRLAKSFEFPDIESKDRPDMLTTIIEYISNQDSGDATATEIANEFQYDRATISRLLNKSGKFVQTRKEKHNVYYGVKV